MGCALNTVDWCCWRLQSHQLLPGMTFYSCEVRVVGWAHKTVVGGTSVPQYGWKFEYQVLFGMAVTSKVLNKVCNESLNPIYIYIYILCFTKHISKTNSFILHQQFSLLYIMFLWYIHTYIMSHILTHLILRCNICVLSILSLSLPYFTNNLNQHSFSDFTVNLYSPSHRISSPEDSLSPATLLLRQTLLFSTKCIWMTIIGDWKSLILFTKLDE